jgi:hypothetical protein
MNEQNFGESTNPFVNVEKTDQGAISPVLIPDSITDNDPANLDLFHETSMSTADPVDPMDGKLVHEAPVGETITHEEALTSVRAEPPAPLLNREEAELLRKRWNEIQGKFVDEPRSAVQQADALVSEVVETITRMFTSEHNLLEVQWNQGIDVSTEDLRKALQHYRSFFNRLVV